MPVRKNTTYSNRPNHAARAAHARGSKKFRTYDTSSIRPKRSKAQTIIFITALVVAVLLLVVALFQFFGCSQNAHLAELGTEITFVVNEGDSGNTVADNLVNAGLISNAADFKRELTNRGDAQNIKPGEYFLIAGSSVNELIDALVAGPNLVKLVIPEGYTLAAIASAVEESSGGRITQADFMLQAARLDDFRNTYSFLSAATSLEGYLFPKTYTLQKEETAKSLIEQMLDQFRQETENLDLSYPQSKGMSDHQVLILASIVEKESAVDNREKVAGVFYNRLFKDNLGTNGYLQSDATTAYVVGHDPTPDEVHANNPYSTYTNKGLPPGPICNPGKEALEAVCRPDKSIIDNDYVFFYFAKDEQGNNKYYFSKTLDEHNAAIAQHS